ncbi:MAG: tetratricopeptide repeat protein, partial [Chloroflexota bacterium]
VEPVERHIVVVRDTEVIVYDNGEVAETMSIEDAESTVALDEYDYFRLAYDHQQDGDYYDAIMDYNRVIQMNPDLAVPYLNRGVAYEQIGGCNGYRAAADFYTWMTRDGISVETLDEVNETTIFNIDLSENTRFDLPLDLVEGQSVNLAVTSVDEDGDLVVDPIIVLLGPDGDIVTANDDMRYSDGELLSMNASIRNMYVGESGEYTLLISHAGGGWDNDATISVTINK